MTVVFDFHKRLVYENINANVFIFHQEDSFLARQRTRKGAPGIVEVAHRAGVSPSTVSRFYTNPEIVRSPTRRKIEEAAKALGYIRDRMAGTLHNRFSGTIGLIVPTIDNAIFAELIQAFAARLRDYDRTMLIAAHGYDLALEVGIIRSLLERRIDGVALIGFDHEPASLEMLQVRNVPVLATWNYREDAPIDCIGANNEDAGFQIARYVADRGHRDIAFLFPPTSSNDRASDRLRGVLRALDTCMSDIPKGRFVETLYDIGAAKRTAMALLQDNRPSAIICGNDIIAQGVVYACQKLGLSIPKDVSIVGIGDFRGSAHIEPGLTTVRLPALEIGSMAAESLCNLVDNGSSGTPRSVLVPANLLERNSVQTLV